MRVQIPAYTDRWMMGDRFGEVVKTSRRHIRTVGIRAALLTNNRHTSEVEIAYVKLDKSGKLVRVILDDCQEITS
jgi:hypothetical protein